MKLILSTELVRFPLTGIGRYNYELASFMAHCQRLSSVKFFTGTGFSEDISVPTANPHMAYRAKRLVQSSRSLIKLYGWIGRALASRQLRSYGDHIFHGTNFRLPPFPGKKVVTIHDISPFTWAHCHPAKRAEFIRSECLKAVASADAIISVSEYARREIADYFSLPLGKIHTVPLASSPEFRVRSEAELGALREYGLASSAYTVFVGTIEPRKNLRFLLDGYARLPSTLRSRIPLVLIGHPGWNSEATHRRIKQGEREGWVRYLGFVPARDLPVLYAGALLFAFPSLYEGFGLPPLEAMASGVPVICSNSSSLPEVVGDAALTHDPEDVEGLTELLSRGLQDAAWREQAIQAGLARAALFSWNRCGEQTLAVYRHVSERS